MSDIEQSNRQILELICSSITSIGKILVVQPFDFIRFRIQTTTKVRLNSFTFIKNMIKTEGFSVILKGSSITSAMVFINSTVHFTLFQEIVSYNNTNFNSKYNLVCDKTTKSGRCFINFESLIKNKKYSPSEWNRKLWFLYFKSGFLAGFLSSLIFTPFDNLRVRLISEKNLLHSTNESSNYKYNKITQLIKTIFIEEGLKGFYTALPLSFLKESMGSAFYFSTFEFTNNNFVSLKLLDNHNFIRTFICGGLAGVANWIITLPFDTIKTTLISSKAHHKAISIKQCISEIYLVEGLTGFYKGFTIMMTRSIIVNGFTLSLFDYLRRYLELK